MGKLEKILATGVLIGTAAIAGFIATNYQSQGNWGSKPKTQLEQKVDSTFKRNYADGKYSWEFKASEYIPFDYSINFSSLEDAKKTEEMVRALEEHYRPQLRQLDRTHLTPSEIVQPIRGYGLNKGYNIQPHTVETLTTEEINRAYNMLFEKKIAPQIEFEERKYTMEELDEAEKQMNAFQDKYLDGCRKAISQSKDRRDLRLSTVKESVKREAETDPKYAEYKAHWNDK